MSRSFKKAIIKDGPRNKKKSTEYWRTVRRVQNQAVKQFKDVPNVKSIVNDYDYSDYTIDYEHEAGYFFKRYNTKSQEYAEKARRK